MSNWPGVDEWLFAVKTFGAAMLALYIAMSIGLDRPYWAMATVYIVSQPLIGSLRSKALYRMIGTVIGATATVVLVPNLVDAPELLSAAMALWVGGCLYISLLDRTPRSYLFILAGYTAALIGFPAVTAPDAIWDTALSRVEEIGLGIMCTTVVGTVVFPRELGPLLSQRILAWVTNASEWTEELLTGGEDPANRAAHIRLAADAVELRMLASQLSYDTSIMQSATRWVDELQRRMVMLLPLLSSIGDRLAALRASDGITPALEALLADLRVWVRAGAPPPRSEADRLRVTIAACEAATDPRAGWNDIMRDSLLLRLGELVDVRQDMRDLRRHIENGGGALTTPLAVPTGGLAAILTILLLCAFWIGTGWSAGSNAASLAAAACCLFATLDDPAPALKKFLVAALLSICFVGIGLFGILPLVHDFEMLALVLAVFFVPVGLLAAMPATQPLGTVLGFLTATLLSLQGAYAADFVTYADGSFAALLGVATAAVVTALMRSVGAEWSARRLLRAGWRDLAAIPQGHTQRGHVQRGQTQRGQTQKGHTQRGQPSRGRSSRDHASSDATSWDGLMALLLDRIGLLVPRLAAVGEGNDLAAVDALTDLRIGVNMVDLQRDIDALPPPVRAVVNPVLFGTAAHFAVQAAAGRVVTPSTELLDNIDRALDAAVCVPGSRGRELLLQLVGIRRGLFQDAPPYQPTPAPTPDDGPVDAAPRQAPA
jgi:uncharacterized membrane protein YccC